MPAPEFAPPTSPEADERQTLSRSQAATRLKISMGSVDKLISAGILGSLPLQAAVVEHFASWPTLTVRAGELTVLRTAPRAPAYPGEGREFIGYHVDMTDEQLAAASLGYWRSDPDKVVGNELFAVTVASFPVAVFRITEKVKTVTRDGEDRPRHLYAGDLLARLRHGAQVQWSATMPGHLRDRVRQLMHSRVVAESGGPIAYLGPAL
ncbi:hypothetical protein [Cellulomonas sp. GbtcB1]|uniref:hypothetical protein n=1 Tax=Cellulomonas sp. GbtcB1 TaxID=2824746 RepID=UPI001C3071E2|nr:hypothetical protein [Cellulomonas sp. GbtcB1]